MVEFKRGQIIYFNPSKWPILLKIALWSPHPDMTLEVQATNSGWPHIPTPPPACSVFAHSSVLLSDTLARNPSEAIHRRFQSLLLNGPSKQFVRKSHEPTEQKLKSFFHYSSLPEYLKTWIFPSFGEIFSYK